MFADAPVLTRSVATGQSVADASLPLVLTLVDQLRGAGLARETAAGWVLAPESGLPDPGEILQTFAADYADAAPEIILAAQALAGLEPALRTGQPVPIRPAIREQFDSVSIMFAPVLHAAFAVCEAVQARIAPEPVRVLVAEPCGLGVLQSCAAGARRARGGHCDRGRCQAPASHRRPVWRDRERCLSGDRR